MHPFEARTAQCISLYSMAERGAHILAGVSGGADSVAMLFALHALGFTLSVVHVHHGLRGDEADRDEAFVKSLCRTLDIPFFCQHYDVADVAKKRGLSLETAGREVRYECFEKLRQQCGAAHIAVAHTTDDNAETVLMHLTRGCGLDGLCGIPPVNGRITRPILQCSRDEVEAYLEHLQAQYVTDSTNAGLDYTRNRIRHLVMPQLNQINPGVSRLLAQSTRILSEDRDYLDMQARALADRCMTCEDGIVTIDLPMLKQSPMALQRRLILLAAKRFDGCTLTLAHTDAIVALDQTGKGLDLPGGVRVTRSYQTLLWTATAQAIPPFCHAVEGNTIFIPETGQTVILINTNLPPEKGELTLDADKLSGKKLLLRSRQPGDKFVPSGMTGTKKLQDYFVDCKISASERDTIPILTADGEIAAVVGCRVASPFCADQYTKHYIKLYLSGGSHE